MKKLLMISAMLLVGVLSVSAQTYCYKNVYKVNKNGVKEKGSGMIRYVTFINNKNTCYLSDKDGYKDNGGLACHYQKAENGVLVYKGAPPSINMGGGLVVVAYSIEFRFSSDYSKYNYIHSMDDDIWVYERITAPDKQNAPVKLY